jgi:spermidine/putrescine transport system permease protein/putrescine transport system permease protein
MAVYLFLYAPVFLVVLFSFNSLQSFGEFGGFSLQWYRQFFDRTDLQDALRNSVAVAVAVTVLATVIGTALAIGLGRSRSRFARSGNLLLLLPIVTPELALATSLLLFFGETGIPSSRATIVVAHTTFLIAFVAIIVRGRLRVVNTEAEDASRDLGAGRLKTLWLVTLPALAPGIIAGALFAFALSFDNFLLSLFTAGPGDQTLPTLVYASVRNQVRPTINAIGTLMLLITVVLIGAAALTLWLANRRRGTGPART